MPSLSFCVAGQNVINIINRYSYAVSYDMREGRNGGTTLDGSLITDMLARKIVIEFTTKVGANVESLLSNIRNNVSVAVTFVEPGDASVRTANFLPEIGSYQVAMFNGANNIVWQESTKIKLTEI